ncbi:MAG TPA: S8 family serine peptidase, partial [Catalimonadaceae bacterium]|nr:S8 family serine peptidase [Catalimonadaceae bacterium]
MKKIYLSALAILLAASHPGFSQDAVLQNTNVKELQKMEQEFQASNKLRQERVQKYAAEKGVLIDHYLPDGKVISIIDIDENGKPVYRETHNAKAAATISTNKVYPSATSASKYNLSGRSFTIGEWDGGTNRITHREYQGRAIQADNGTMALSEHATHVGGTLIAGGVVPTVRGMAYQAKLLANDWNNDDAEMTSRAAQGLLVSNHSYGTPSGWSWDGQWVWSGDDNINPLYDYKFGYYDTQARDWDRISRNAPYYLITKSAGNSRGDGPPNGTRPQNGPYDCLPTYSNAKNILTVGAVRPLVNGYSTPTGVQMTTFSSWGPSDDGRIKPDIVGDGEGVISCGIA